jgi:hypothetical protein
MPFDPGLRGRQDNRKILPMNRRAVIGISVVGITALAATLGIFAAGGGNGSTASNLAMTGHTSKDVADVEARYKDLQARWRDHEKSFKDKQSFPELGKLDADCEELQGRVRALKAGNEIEKKALPHLVESVEAFRRVLPVYIMYFVNESILKPSDWESARKDAILSNSAWRAWTEATRTLSREKGSAEPQK